jgi:hypothetical protein
MHHFDYFCDGYGAAAGYGLANGVSTVVITPDFRMGTEQQGVGFDVMVGIGVGPAGVGLRAGGSYYWKSHSDRSGFEGRVGFTAGVGHGKAGLSYNVTHFSSGETSQTTAMARIAYGHFYIKYENDQMLFADKGDRFRTAAQEIGYGPFKMGATMFTGDPDDISGKRPSDKIEGYDYYVSKNGSKPDKYRAGIGYIGFGNFKIGMNSEKIRHAIQNVLVHDSIGVPRFRKLEDEYPDTFYWSFGASQYTLY